MTVGRMSSSLIVGTIKQKQPKFSGCFLRLIPSNTICQATASAHRLVQIAKTSGGQAIKKTKVEKKLTAALFTHNADLNTAQ